MALYASVLVIPKRPRQTPSGESSRASDQSTDWHLLHDDNICSDCYKFLSAKLKANEAHRSRCLVLYQNHTWNRVSSPARAP